MRALAARSAPGSRLAMTYVEPETTPPRIFDIRMMVRFFGEPFRGEMTRATAAERLSLAGLHVVEDTGLGRVASPLREPACQCLRRNPRANRDRRTLGAWRPGQRAEELLCR